MTMNSVGSAMRERLLRQLKEVETRYGIKVLYAYETGSRGWEWRKALGLLKGVNPTLIEWLDSPVVYQQDEATVAALKSLVPQWFSPLRAFIPQNWREGKSRPRYRTVGKMMFGNSTGCCMRRWWGETGPCWACPNLELHHSNKLWCSFCTTCSASVPGTRKHRLWLEAP